MNRKLADDAVTLGKWITACCAMVLAFMALGYLALVGDEIQQERIQAQQDVPRDYGPPSKVPPNVWQRICEDGENYLRGRCQ